MAIYTNQLATNAIITLQELKQYLKITKKTYDDLLRSIINAVSDFVEDTTQRKYKQQTITDEKHHGDGIKTTFFTKWAPIISVTSLYDDPDRDSTSQTARR